VIKGIVVIVAFRPRRVLRLIDGLFVFPGTRARYRDAPLLKEREAYLLHLLQQGRDRKHLRLTAAMILHSVRLLNLVNARPVNQIEVSNASARWVADDRSYQRKRGRKNSAYNFSRITVQWLRFQGMLVEGQKPEPPFEKLVNSYLENIQYSKGLSPTTISSLRNRLSTFQIWSTGKATRIEETSLNDLDTFLDFLQAKGWRSRTIASTSQALRGFFRFGEAHNCCANDIARGILSPRLSKRQVGTKGPVWRDVRKLLRSTIGLNPVELRAKAIISLCSIYALRRGEVVRLRLKDLDWLNETLTV
jgi:integrase/recombinase XerD